MPEVVDRMSRHAVYFLRKANGTTRIQRRALSALGLVGAVLPGKDTAFVTPSRPILTIIAATRW
jgi:hypothetical protein